MPRRHSLVSLVTALVLLGLCALVSPGKAAPVHNPVILGNLYGYQTSNSNPWVNQWMIIDVTSQTAFDDTGGGTHNPWSHISGTIHFLFGNTYNFTGTVRAGGRVDLTYYAGFSSTTYTGYAQDVGDATTGPIYYLPGTYVTTTTFYFYNFWTHQFIIYTWQSDAGTFAVDQDPQDD